MSRLGWYWNRLRSMGPVEVAWRGSRAASGAARRVLRSTEPSDARLLGAEPEWAALLDRFRRAAGRPVLLDQVRAEQLAAAYPEDAAAAVAAADRAIAGRFAFFGYPEVTLPSPIDWNHDPVSGTRWPSVPSGRIDHRTAAGDPKWIWELNRLQHLPWLAQAWLFTGQPRYAEQALDQLDSWLEQNPPGVGIAWRGAFEAGVRAISVAVAVQGLREAPGLTTDRYRRIVRMLAESARRCWRDRSRFSSANNHLVGELAGLATVAMLFPELPGARAAEHRALRALATEADRQILPDGAGAEQAIGYQIFTAELMLVVVALLRLRGDPPPAPMVAALERSAAFLAALVGDGDPVPRFGDDDEGFALRLGWEPVRELRRHLGAVAVLTGQPDAGRYGVVDLTAGWLGGPSDAAQSTPAQLAAAGDPSSFLAPHGGLVVLRSGRRRVTMDVGPLGYRSIAAHGHADALSLTLSIDGRELIGDPGAASYYGHPEWRTVHRGTRVHATVSVDETDQSVIGGPFLWTRHARVTVRAVDLARGVVDAEHDGYRRLDRPVTHRRWLVAPPGADALLVVDLLTGRGVHRVRTSWPLHPELDAVGLLDGHLVTRRGAAALRLHYSATADWSRHEVRGDPVSHLGWWSNRLESREPAWLVGSVCETRLPVVLTTLLQPLRGADSAAELTTRRRRATIEVTWREDERPRRVVLDPRRPGAADLQ